MSELASFQGLPERYRLRAVQIAARVREIDAALKPCVPSEIGDAVVRMFRQFMEQPGTDRSEMAAEYRAACSDLPAWAISEAANDFLWGRVDNHTGRYMPVCAEFAKRARSILIPFLAERHALKTEAEKLVERAADDHRRHLVDMERQDPAVKARVAELAASVTKGHASPVVAPHIGLSKEKHKRIDALKKPRQFVSKLGETRIARGE